MFAFSLPSGRPDRSGDRAFRRSIMVSLTLHAIVIAIAGGMTLFHTTGTVYAPTYMVDLVSISSSPGTPGKGAGSGPGPSGAQLKLAVAGSKTAPVGNDVQE